MPSTTMPSVTASTLAAILLLPAGPAVAQTSWSDRICSAARQHLQTLAGQPPMSAFLVTTDYQNGRWARVSSRQFLASTIPDSDEAQLLYIAYVRRPAPGEAGAISVRIAVPAENGSRPTNRVELHRAAIRTGDNSCERRGRRTMDRTVRVNQYIDYHRRDAVNSSLEDFHFAYPTTTQTCTRTDRKEAKENYLFAGVERTLGDSFIARNFGFIGPAYGVIHNFGRLRSELHYRPPQQQPGIACAGFRIAITTTPTQIEIQHEHGPYWQWIPGRASLAVRR